MKMAILSKIIYRFNSFSFMFPLLQSQGNKNNILLSQNQRCVPMEQNKWHTSTVNWFLTKIQLHMGEKTTSSTNGFEKTNIFMSRSKTRFLSLFLHNDQGSQHKTSNFKTIRKNGSTFQDKAIGRNFLNSTSLYSGKKTNNWQIKSHHFF